LQACNLIIVQLLDRPSHLINSFDIIYNLDTGKKQTVKQISTNNSFRETL